MSPSMIDLCSGSGGASAAMRDRGWDIVTLDIDPQARPDVVGDIRRLPLREELRPDLLWASPPCEDFSRTYMPWLRGGDPEEGIALVRAARAAVEHLQPRYWVIENVQGAPRWLRPILGRHVMRMGNAYLWGDFPLPMLGAPPDWRKQDIAGQHPELRAMIPYEISEAFAEAVETAISHDRRADLREFLQDRIVW